MTNPMTDMIYRAEATSLPPYDGDGDPAGQFDHHIFVKLSDLRDLPAAQVAVTPLEWEADLGDGILTARAYGHIYRIIRTTEGGFFVPELLPLHFPNPAAAKAAVQSTHERHIAPALTITPAPDPAQIREAALRDGPETLASLVHHLRVMADRQIDAIDSDRLMRAAALIDTPPATPVKTATPDYTLGASELSLPAVSPDVAALVEAVSAEIEARNLFLSTAPDRGGSHGPKGQRKMALENAQLATVFALARLGGCVK